MTRWPYLLCLFLLISHNCLSQSNNLDSLGNLWIITIDKSGSMLFNEHDKYTFSNRLVIAENVANRLAGNKLKNINYRKDKFLFLYSGIITTNDLSHIRFESRFDTSFIHHVDSTLHSFNNKNDLVSHIRAKLEEGNYRYDYSFVSQIRLFSIVKTINFMKDRRSTDQFNRLFFVIITDDADQNDQWMNDYKNVKRFAPEKLQEVNVLTTRYLYNPFNTKADYSRSGSVIEVFQDESETPHINAFEYRTTQSFEIKNDSLQLLAFRSAGDTILTIRPLHKKHQGDPINFVYLDSLYINNKSLPIKKWFTDSLQIPLKLESRLGYHTLNVRGHFQVHYEDSILGKHYRKHHFTQSAAFPSTLLATSKFYAIIVAGSLLLIFLVYTLILSPNKKLFRVYDDLQHKLTIKRGSRLFGNFYSWDRGENILAGYVRDAAGKVSAIFKKQKNLVNSRHNYIPSHESDIHTVAIASRSPLFIDNSGNISVEHFSTDMKDIEEFHDARDFNALFRSIYHRSFNYRLLRFGKKYKIRNTWLFTALTWLTNGIRKHHYYIISLTKFNYNNASISFSGESFRKKTFTIEFTAVRVRSVHNENEARNSWCLQSFYSDTEKCADGMITVNLFRDKIVWNVLKLEDQKSLCRAYHVFNFTQHLNGADLDKTQVAQNIEILKELAGSKPLGIRKCIVFATRGGNADIPPALSALSNINYAVQPRDGVKNAFSFRKSAYQSFLYLVETEENNKRKNRLLYSPFSNGTQHEVMTQTPSRGTYFLFNSFAPPFVERAFNENYSYKLADNIFSFSTMRDVKLNIDEGQGRIVYLNHSIKLNGL